MANHDVFNAVDGDVNEVSVMGRIMDALAAVCRFADRGVEGCLAHARRMDRWERRRQRRRQSPPLLVHDARWLGLRFPLGT